MSMLEELSSVADQIQNPLLEDWMNQGKKVIGYFCTYIPEEIIMGAGALPFRMRAVGSTQTTLGDAYLSYYNCSFTRHCLDLAFEENTIFWKELWVNQAVTMSGVSMMSGKPRLTHRSSTSSKFLVRTLGGLRNGIRPRLSK